MKHIILAVDDDDAILELIKNTFPKKEYSVLTADSAKTCLAILKETIPDIIILDVELPDACGFDVCKTIKKDPATSQIPVIFLSGRRITPEDVSCGYEDGAINYLIKPFNPDVLLAISRSLFKWVAHRGKMPQIFKKDGITLNAKEREARLDGKNVKLTTKEFELLFLLLKSAGKVVEKETLLNAVWGHEELEVCEHSLNEYMSRLRTKLGAPLADKIITIYGAGYKFEKLAPRYRR